MPIVLATVDGCKVTAPVPTMLAPLNNVMLLAVIVISPVINAFPISESASVVVRLPSNASPSWSAVIVIPPVVAAPTVAPALRVISPSALRVIRPEPESTSPLAPMVKVAAAAVTSSKTVPLPFADIASAVSRFPVSTVTWIGPLEEVLTPVNPPSVAPPRIKP